MEVNDDFDSTNSIEKETIRKSLQKKRSKCGGWFSGLKDSRLTRIHTFLFFLKRFLQWVVLFMLKDLSTGAKLGFFFGLQVVFFVAYIIIKPHKQYKDQLIEIINELIYIILISRLFYFNDQTDWTNAEKISFLTLIVLNFVLQAIISLGNLSLFNIIVFLIKYWFDKKKKPEEDYQKETNKDLNNNSRHVKNSSSSSYNLSRINDDAVHVTFKCKYSSILNPL